MINNFTDPKKGFASIVILVIAIVVLGAVTVSYFLIFRGEQITAPTQDSPQSPQQSKAVVSADPKLLIGFWKKESGGLPDDGIAYDYVEIKEKEICVGYSSGALRPDGTYDCPSYQPYRIVDDGMVLGSGQKPFYRFNLRDDGKLELETVGGSIPRAVRVYTQP